MLCGSKFATCLCLAGYQPTPPFCGAGLQPASAWQVTNLPPHSVGQVCNLPVLGRLPTCPTIRSGSSKDVHPGNVSGILYFAANDDSGATASPSGAPSWLQAFWLEALLLTDANAAALDGGLALRALWPSLPPEEAALALDWLLAGRAPGAPGS